MASKYILGMDLDYNKEHLVLKDRYHREKAERYYKKCGYWEMGTSLTNGIPQRVVPLYEIKLRLRYRTGPSYQQWRATIRGKKQVFDSPEISYYLIGEVEDPLDTFDIEQIISYEIKISTSMSNLYTSTGVSTSSYLEERWRQDQLRKQQTQMQQMVSSPPPWFVSRTPGENSEKKKSSERRREILLLLKF